MDAETKERFDRIDLALAALLATQNARDNATARATTAAPALPPVDDLDSDYGNILIKKPPPRWKGEDFSGKRLSETSAEFCDAVASFKAWAAKKDRDAGDETKAGYSDRDRARAEGWAARFRAGWKAPTKAVSDDGTDLPF